MPKPYRTTKIIIPGWEKCNQRAYLVVDRETGEPLGRVHDSRLWNLYDPAGDHWKIAHSDEDIDGSCYSTMGAAVKKIWREHKPVEASTEFPPNNLKYAQNFDYQSD